MSNRVPNSKSPTGASRRYPRYPLDIRLSVNVFRDGKTVSLWGRSNEMGRDGIGGTLTGELEPGEVVSMEISFPLTPYPMKIRALVRYRDGLRHGFEFLAMSPEQHETIQRVCEMLATGT